MGKGRGAFVTLLTKPSYLAGTLVVDYGLRKVNSKYPFVAMISSDLPQTCVDILKLRGIETVPIQRLTPKSMHNGIIKEERFRDTWCKLAWVYSPHICWEYEEMCLFKLINAYWLLPDFLYVPYSLLKIWWSIFQLVDYEVSVDLALRSILTFVSLL